jgi:hypothetical protein
MQPSLHDGLSSMRFANADAGSGSLASRLRDASTTICRATADRCDSSTGRLQCLVQAARARPELMDKGVSHVMVTQRCEDANRSIADHVVGLLMINPRWILLLLSLPVLVCHLSSSVTQLCSQWLIVYSSSFATYSGASRARYGTTHEMNVDECAYWRGCEKQLRP